MAKMSQSKKPVASVARRQPIGEGNDFTRRFEVLDDNRVKASYTFKLDENSKQKYGVTTILDYSKCSKAEILIDASRSHVITLQRELRAMREGALNADVYMNVDVKVDILDAGRATVDPETRGLHAFMKSAGVTDIDLARKYIAAIASGKLKL